MALKGAAALSILLHNYAKYAFSATAPFYNTIHGNQTDFLLVHPAPPRYQTAYPER